jgi:proteasome lid subunit RPN8/RPN11
LRSAVVRVVVAHARREEPAECCGILLAQGDDIVEAVPTRNLADDPNRFFVDPKEHIDARRDARRRGLVVAGFYHSHPRSAPEPSPRDIAEATFDDCLYLILSLTSSQPEMGLFRLKEGAFVPAPFVTVP